MREEDKKLSILFFSHSFDRSLDKIFYDELINSC